MDSQYKVTPGMIEQAIIGCTYTLLPSGKTMVCELTLKNGFTVRGEASVVDKSNFDQAKGEEASYRRAYDQIWPLLGYMMQERMHQDKLSEETRLDEARNRNRS